MGGCLLPLLCNAVTFPVTESLVQHIVAYLEVGKSMDFLAKSAAKIINGRKLESDHSALVSFWFDDYKLHALANLITVRIICCYMVL